MKANRKCPECGTPMVSATEDYPYDESGLSGVVLRGIEVRRCTNESCGEVMPVIPSIEGLHREIARSIVEKEGRLVGEEVRFLRKYLGLRGIDFARVMGTAKETVSRWENDHEQIGAASDRALRLLAVTQKPISDYAPEVLQELLARIGDECRRISRTLSRRSGGWEARAA